MLIFCFPIRKAARIAIILTAMWPETIKLIPCDHGHNYKSGSALVNKNWTQGTTKTTWQLIKLYTTKFLAILLGGKVIEGIGRALLVEEDHIIIDFLSDRLITGHV